MDKRLVHVETIAPPQEYEPRQITLACQIAGLLNRGRFILCIPPVQWPPQ